MTLTLREAQPGDAAAVIAYLNVVTNEPGINLLISPGEFQHTVLEEQQIIAGFAASPNSLFLLAEDGAEIVGVLTCRGGNRQANRHVTTLGITVAKSHRGKGLGSALMQVAIDWAQQGGVVRRMELFVFAGNTGAIRLYQRLGFEVEGALRRAVYRDGEFQDDLVMSRLF
jgi:RimJ/RimL family protein N-acetyltransferase